MMGFIRHICALLIGTITACVQSRNVPEDFYIRIESSSVQPGGEGRALVIERKPDTAVFEWSYFDGTRSRSLLLTEHVVQQIADEINRCKAFKLKDQYANFNVLDGETNILTIRMRGREKRIQMRNITPEELSPLLDRIWKAGN